MKFDVLNIKNFLINLILSFLVAVTLFLIVGCGPGDLDMIQIFSVGGDVSGSTGTLVLQKNGANDLTVVGDGEFEFTSQQGLESDYTITVLSSPTGQFCTVANGSGNVGLGGASNVIVTCAGTTFLVGGTISGLAGNLVLQNNGGDPTSVNTDGSFSFATPIAESSPYNVTVFTQPNDQLCTVSNGSGTATAAVTDVSVSCVSLLKIFATTGTMNGSLGGVAGADAICQAQAAPHGVALAKALIVGTGRVACTTADCSGGPSEHTDWVLAANQLYGRPDGTIIGSTNANGIFTFPLTNSMTSAGADIRAWTGIGTSWVASPHRCNNWTQSGGGLNGSYGRLDRTDSWAIYRFFQLCTDVNYLYCVEQ